MQCLVLSVVYSPIGRFSILLIHVKLISSQLMYLGKYFIKKYFPTLLSTDSFKYIGISEAFREASQSVN